MYQRPVRDEKLREVSVSYFFALINTPVLSRIFSQALLSISNQHNYKTFTKHFPAFLLHYIENILNHSSGKCLDSLTISVVSFTKLSQVAFVQCLFTNISLATAVA